MFVRPKTILDLARSQGPLASLRCFASLDTATTAQQGVPDKLYKKVEIEVRGNDPEVLRSYGIFTIKSAQHLGIVTGTNKTPKKPIHERLTLLKSVHIHKKHRVQYETRTYYRMMDFLRLTGSTADTFLEYIQRNLPEGVAMKVTKHEIQTLPEAVREPPVQDTSLPL